MSRKKRSSRQLVETRKTSITPDVVRELCDIRGV